MSQYLNSDHPRGPSHHLPPTLPTYPSKPLGPFLPHLQSAVWKAALSCAALSPAALPWVTPKCLSGFHFKGASFKASQSPSDCPVLYLKNLVLSHTPLTLIWHLSSPPRSGSGLFYSWEMPRAQHRAWHKVDAQWISGCCPDRPHDSFSATRERKMDANTPKDAGVDIVN